MSTPSELGYKRLKDGRYANTSTGEIVSGRQARKEARGGISDEAYAKQRREAGIPNPLDDYNMRLRNEQERYRNLSDGDTISIKELRESQHMKDISRFMREFRETDKEARTRAQWQQYEDYMEEIYGPDETDWEDTGSAEE